jgi:hypothetical protein
MGSSGWVDTDGLVHMPISIRPSKVTGWASRMFSTADTPQNSRGLCSAFLVGLARNYTQHLYYYGDLLSLVA